MPVTPATGIFAKQKNRLRDSLASCYYFRRWQGNLWSREEAKQRIYLDALPPPPDGHAYTRVHWESLRPFALIYVTELEMMTNAEPGGFFTRGALTIEFEQNIPAEIAGDPAEIDRQFDNELGDMVFTGDADKPGLWDLSKIAHQGYFQIDRLQPDGPWRTAEDRISDVGDASMYQLHLTWGTRG